VPHFDGSAALAGGQGTLLAVVPADDGRSHIAIVGYLLPGPFPRVSPDAGRAAIVRAPAGMVVDRDQRRVLVEGRDAGLAFQEFELLEFLMAHPSRAFTREQLLLDVWAKEHRVTTRTVDIHVHRLRRKLGSAIAPCLVTVRRIGYMFRPSGLAR
jgi:DNA-binding response OmpR family regulator